MRIPSFKFFLYHHKNYGSVFLQFLQENSFLPMYSFFPPSYVLGTLGFTYFYTAVSGVRKGRVFSIAYGHKASCSRSFLPLCSEVLVEFSYFDKDDIAK